MRNSFIANLSELQLPQEIINQVVRCFDFAAADFDITPKETGLIVGNYMPELAKTFIAVKSVEGCSANTLYNYKLTLQNFFQPIGNVPMEEITANHIRGYLHLYQMEHHVQACSLENARSIICGFFTWAVDEGYLVKNPGKAVKPIKKEKKQRHALDRTSLEKLRRACQDLREKMLVDVLFSTGCRISELCGIRIQDVDFRTGEVLVTGKGNKQRIVYLNPAAMLSIRDYLKSRADENPYLVVSERAPHHQMDRNRVGRIIKAIGARANVDVTPHVLRHTTATIALRSGMPVQSIQKMLGHSSIATTMIYAETDQTDVKSEHNRCVV